MQSPESKLVTVSEEISDTLPVIGSGHAEVQLSRGSLWVQALILVLLYSAPGIWCFRIAGFADPDVWWHLRTGEWILQHHALPHTDPFSSFGAGKPWSAYSWLFDLLILQLFQRLGLTGLVTYSIGMVVAVAIALHRLIRRLQSDFSLTLLLTFAASYCLVDLGTPRSWWFSILFFVLELDILMQARKTGKPRELLWLPVIFALWANLHIQFIDGLIVLAFALAEAALAHWWSGIETRIRPVWLWGVSVACLLATLLNPYGWNVYRVAFDLATMPGVLNKLNELSGIPFRSFSDFVVLFFVLAATWVLARARRIAPFEIVLLAFAVIVSFRSQRDVWVVITVACAILAARLKVKHENRFQLTAFAAPFVAIGTGLLIFLVFHAFHVGNAQMEKVLAKNLPVHAVEVVKERGYSGPLFNGYDWGGYLIWALRLPVSIDGRAGLYGDQWIGRSLATWNAQPDWASDPDLAKAALVVGPVKAPLTQVLRMNPHYELVFEDKLAAVFVARRALPGRGEPLAVGVSESPHATRK